MRSRSAPASRAPATIFLSSARPGSDCAAAARAKLKELAGDKKHPPDWVYLSYFDADGGFRTLQLPPGTRQASPMPWRRRSIVSLTRCPRRLPPTTTSSSAAPSRRSSASAARTRSTRCGARRRRRTLRCCAHPPGIAVAPILEGKVVRNDIFNSVPESLRREVETKIAALEAEIEQILAERPGAEKARRERLLALNEQIAGRQVRAALDEIKAEFAEVSGMERYLNAAGRDLVRNAGLFLAFPGHEAMKIPPAPSAISALPATACTSWPRQARRKPARRSSRSRTRPMPICSAASSSARRRGTGAGEPHQAWRSASRQRRLPASSMRASCSRRRRLVEALARALETQEIRFDPPADAVGDATARSPTWSPSARREARRPRRRRYAPRLAKSHPALRAPLQGRGGLRRGRRTLHRDDRRLCAPHRRHRRRERLEARSRPTASRC